MVKIKPVVTFYFSSWIVYETFCPYCLVAVATVTLSMLKSNEAFNKIFILLLWAIYNSKMRP